MYAKFQLQWSSIVVLVVTSKLQFLRIFGRVHYTEVAKTQWVLKTTIWNSAILLPIKMLFQVTCFYKKWPLTLSGARKVLSISLNIYPNTNFVLPLSRLQIWSWDWDGKISTKTSIFGAFWCIFHCYCQILGVGLQYWYHFDAHWILFHLRHHLGVLWKWKLSV